MSGPEPTLPRAAEGVSAGPAETAPVPVAGFTVPYRVRFDESTPDGTVRTSALLRYAQDCAWVHSEALGFGREWYAERDLAWLVRAVRLVVRAHPSTGASLAVTTGVIGFRRVMARRLTTMRDADGMPVAEIHTDWVMTDARRGVPTRIPEAFPARFAAPPGGFEPHRVGLPATPADAVLVDLQVRPHDLDPMAHANNAAYVDWLEACALRLPDGLARLRALPRTYLLEYLLPATPDALLVGAAWASDASLLHRLVHGDEELLRGRLDPGSPDGPILGA